MSHQPQSSALIVTHNISLTCYIPLQVLNRWPPLLSRQLHEKLRGRSESDRKWNYMSSLVEALQKGIAILKRKDDDGFDRLSNRYTIGNKLTCHCVVLAYVLFLNCAVNGPFMYNHLNVKDTAKTKFFNKRLACRYWSFPLPLDPWYVDLTHILASNGVIATWFVEYVYNNI